ncbi:MAG: Fis family transcriptional regulator [Thioalkalivibrio sp.]|nr:MAG: Fis family transcriptional regulator [Thioalkalivibrio sp.]
MSDWIEEQGVVVAADEAWATVRVERQSTCGSCSARSGCGNGVLSEVLGRRSLELRLANSHGLRPGDRVTLGVRDQALVSGAFAMYLLPLLGMMLAPITLGWMLPGLADGFLVLAGVAGFALGLAGVRRWLRSQGDRFEPVLLGRQPAGESPMPSPGSGRIAQ